MFVNFLAALATCFIQTFFGGVKPLRPTIRLCTFKVSYNAIKRINHDIVLAVSLSFELLTYDFIFLHPFSIRFLHGIRTRDLSNSSSPLYRKTMASNRRLEICKFSIKDAQKMFKMVVIVCFTFDNQTLQSI